MQTLQASANPDMARSVLDQALNDVQPSASVETPPIPAPPADTIVELPFGYVDPYGNVQRVAEVRELNGIDEEALARIPAGNTGRMLAAILERGVVRLGSDVPNPDVLDGLVVADRDILLLAIRRVTYGEHVELVVTCADCKETTELSVSLDAVPMNLPEDRTQRTFTLPLRVGEAVLMLPNGKVQREIANAGEKTSAELNTILISGCLRSLNGISLMGPSQARGLSLRDRKTVLTALIDKLYGPQLSDIPVACATCRKEISLSLSMGDLFRM